MNKVILCEGVTDAILLSYYLEKTAGWKYCKGPKHLSIRETENNESVNWYCKAEDYLLICAVGGKDNFRRFFEEKIKAPIITANAFEKLAVVTDRDDREISSIEMKMQSTFHEILTTVQNNHWCENTYQDSFGMDKRLEMLLVVVPREHQGALETVMLESISEDSYDRNIVEKAGIFAAQMRNEAEKYISSDRLQLKAHLGITWAVQYPEKVFRLIDEQIRSVSWENSEVLDKCFAVLRKI